MIKQSGKTFDNEFSALFDDLIAWRRDVRHFTNAPVDETMLQDCLHLANLSPSVGLSQPWRFVDLRDADRRKAIISNFEKCNADALADYHGLDKKNYARLKLEGLQQAPIHLAVFADTTTTKGKNLGRKTMPEMTAYSVVTAIHTFWLAARVRGLGVGWVSILNPAKVAETCQTPPDWHLIGYLCVGWPKQQTQTPELESAGWERRVDLSTFYKKL